LGVLLVVLGGAASTPTTIQSAPGTSVVSGCLHNAIYFRLANYRSVMWTSNTLSLGAGVLRIAYHTDEDYYRDPRDTMAVAINGATVATLFNTGCSVGVCHTTVPYPAGRVVIQVTAASSNAQRGLHMQINQMVHIPNPAPPPTPPPTVVGHRIPKDYRQFSPPPFWTEVVLLPLTQKISPIMGFSTFGKILKPDFRPKPLLPRPGAHISAFRRVKCPRLREHVT